MNDADGKAEGGGNGIFAEWGEEGVDGGGGGGKGRGGFGDVDVAGAGFVAEKEPGALAFGLGADLLGDFEHAYGGFRGAD